MINNPFGTRQRDEFIHSYMILLKERLEAELPESDIEPRMLMIAGNAAFDMSTHIVSAMQKPLKDGGY